MKDLTKFYAKKIYGKEPSVNFFRGETLLITLPKEALTRSLYLLLMLLTLTLLLPLPFNPKNLNQAYKLTAGWNLNTAKDLSKLNLPPNEGELYIPANNGLYYLPQNEQLLLELVNNAREEEGLEPYILDEQLTYFARIKGEDMLNHNYIEHYSPTLGRPGEFAAKNGFNFSLYGENLAGTLKDSHLPPEIAFHHLMLSEYHRKAILHTKATHIGIGAVKGKEHGMVYVMHFALK